MFWGAVLKDSKPYELRINGEGVLFLNHVCLGTKGNRNKIYFQLEVGEEVYNVCVLQRDKWESCKLDHCLNFPGKRSRLIAYGNDGNEVHVTGYVEALDDEFVDERETNHINRKKKFEEKGSQINVMIETKKDESIKAVSENDSLYESDYGDIEIDEAIEQNVMEDIKTDIKQEVVIATQVFRNKKEEELDEYNSRDLEQDGDAQQDNYKRNEIKEKDHRSKEEEENIKLDDRIDVAEEVEEEAFKDVKHKNKQEINKNSHNIKLDTHDELNSNLEFIVNDEEDREIEESEEREDQILEKEGHNIETNDAAEDIEEVYIKQEEIEENNAENIELVIVGERMLINYLNSEKHDDSDKQFALLQAEKIAYNEQIKSEEISNQKDSVSIFEDNTPLKTSKETFIQENPKNAITQKITPVKSFTQSRIESDSESSYDSDEVEVLLRQRKKAQEPKKLLEPENKPPKYPIKNKSQTVKRKRNNKITGVDK
jgi:hypothetical protein